MANLLIDGYCEWFALCIRPSFGVVKHPILGEVPICRECAAKHDLTVE